MGAEVEWEVEWEVGWEGGWEVEWEEKLLNTVSSHHNFQRLSVMLSHKGLEWEALEAWEGQEWEAQEWDLEVVQWVEVVQEAVPDLEVVQSGSGSGSGSG